MIRKEYIWNGRMITTNIMLTILEKAKNAKEVQKHQSNLDLMLISIFPNVKNIVMPMELLLKIIFYWIQLGNKLLPFLQTLNLEYISLTKICSQNVKVLS